MTSVSKPSWQEILERETGILYSGAALAIGGLSRETETFFAGQCFPGSDSPKVLNGSLFDLSSLTKVFLTTSVVARLIDRDVIALDDPFYTWCPELPWANVWKSVSLRQILAHSAGFPAWRDYSKLSKLETLNAIVQEKPLAPPGEQTVYSDLGFILLAAVLETHMGRPWIQICEDEVIRPLRLNRMTPSPVCQSSFPEGIVATEPSGRRMSDWADVQDANARAFGGVSGHAGYFADLEACVRITQTWLQALDGESSFLSGELALEFATPCVNKTGGGRALGWDVPSLSHSSAGMKVSKRAIGHLGFTGTSVWMDLNRNAWVILLTNRTCMNTSIESMRAFRISLHDAVWEWMDG